MARCTGRSGVVTRGTTNPNRLRRVDNWIVATCGDLLRGGGRPAGGRPRLRRHPGHRRRAARPAGRRGPRRRTGGRAGDRPGTRRRRAAGRRPARADVRPGRLRAGRAAARCWSARSTCCASTTRARSPDAWRTMTAALAPGGLLVEGTCDELGRLASWAAARRRRPAARSPWPPELSTLDSPAELGRAAAQGADPPQRARRAGPRPAPRAGRRLARRRRVRPVRPPPTLAARGHAVARPAGRSSTAPPLAPGELTLPWPIP